MAIVKTLDAPLQQFKDEMQHLKDKLVSANWLKRARRTFIWHFRKEEIKDTFASLERYKLLFNLALQNDHT